jgi:hypothetical protein
LSLLVQAIDFTLAGSFSTGSLGVWSTVYSPESYTNNPSTPQYEPNPAPPTLTTRIVAGGSVSASNAMIGHDMLIVDGGILGVGGTLTLGFKTGYVENGTAKPIDAAGTLMVVNGGLSQIGSVTMVAGGVTLDATSMLEIGHGGTFLTGTLVVDAGATLASSFSAPATLNNGLIVAGGTVANISGGGTLTPNGVLTLGPNIGNVIGFKGAGAVNFNDPLINPGITLANFTSQNAVMVQGEIPDAAIYTKTTTGVGTLAISHAGTVIEAVTLLGNYDSARFAAVHGIVTIADPGISTRTIGNTDYITVNGSVFVPGTLMIGRMAGYYPSPGSSSNSGVYDVATFFDVLDGARLTASDLEIMTGTVSVAPTGVMELGNAGTGAVGTLTIDPGRTLSIHTGRYDQRPPGINNSNIFPPETEKRIIAAPVQNNGSISGRDGQALFPGTGFVGVVVPIEFGRVINTGVISDVQSIGTLLNTGKVSTSIVRSGTNQGTIFNSDVSNLVNSGTILSGTVTAVSGNGLLSVTNPYQGVGEVPFGQMSIGKDVTNPVTFGLPLALLTIVAMPTVSIDTTPVIRQMGTTDNVLLQGVVADKATLTSSAPNTGTLTAYNNGVAVAALELEGDLSAYGAMVRLSDATGIGVDPFTGGGLIIPGINQTQLSLAIGTTGAGTLAPSAGTASGHSYSWTSVKGGDWGNAGNWQDTTIKANPATIAPGTKDQVTIDNSIDALRPYLNSTVDFFQVVSGQGNAASLTTLGDVALGGIFNAPIVTVGTFGNLSIVDGGQLTADQIHMDGAMLQVLHGTLTATGTVTSLYPILAAADHAVVRLGGFRDTAAPTGSFLNSHIYLDATSIVEIGTAGTGVAGTLTVDSGAVLSVGFVAGAVLNNGTILRGQYDGIVNNGTIVEATILGAINSGTIVGGRVQNVTGSGIVAAGKGSQSLLLGKGVGQTVQYLETGSKLTINTGVTTTATIAGFSQGDTLVVNDASNADTASWVATGASIGTLSLSLSGTVLATVTLAGDYTGDTFFTFHGIVSVNDALIPCFAEGTRILTPDGERRVETLRDGDLITTARPDGVRAIRWLGYRTARREGHPRPNDIMPIRIQAGAFSDGIPARDLLLSPDHAVYAEGVLIPVKHLVNGTTIRQMQVDSVTYWHVELDQHDIVLAEGLPTESYLDTGDRSSFANGGGAVAMHPVFNGLTWDARGCAELVVTGPVLERVRAGLRERASLTAFSRARLPAHAAIYV